AESLARNTGSRFFDALVDLIGSAVAGEVVAGGTVQVTEGATWDIGWTVTDGIATLSVVHPPGGEAWSKRALSSGATLTGLAKGTYRVSSGSVAAGLGLPTRVGSLDILEATGSGR